MAFNRSFDLPHGEFGRRHFLIGALASGVALTRASSLFASTEFWNAKDPSAWTEEEIVMLTTKSPWVREAVANIKNPDDPTGGRVLGESSGGRGGRPAPPLRVFVRWESAQPILDALKATLPADFAGRYVVSVTNLPFRNLHRAGPAGETASDDTLDRIQNGATLEVKGRDALEAGIVRQTHIGSFLFGFSKDRLPLSPGDRDIVFALNTEQLTLKAKFDAKEMSYHGKLAV